MKTEVADVSPTRKEIKIEIDTATVRQTYDRISDRYAKQASVPGFRPGHAPRAVVRTRYKSEIRAQALQELVPEAVDEAIKEHAPNAIGEPDVQLDNAEALEKFGEEPLAVKVNVEVLPKVELQNYKGIEIVRQTRPVTDANVDEMLEALRETSAAMQPVEDRLPRWATRSLLISRGSSSTCPTRKISSRTMSRSRLAAKVCSRSSPTT